MIILRPDQQQLKQDICNAWNSGAQNVMGVLPTGGGKSIIVSDIVLDSNNRGAVQAVIAHRNELVGQMSLHIARRGIKHRIIGSRPTVSSITAEHRLEFGRSFVNPDANCTVASVDTLIARTDQLKQWSAQVDDWTIDEVHHVLRNNKWGKAVSMFPNAKGLGVTASPQRADGMGLGRHHDGVFDVMVQGPDMRTLIEMGALCDYQIVIPESDFNIDDSELAPSGDWSNAKMREASKKSHIVGDVVEQYVKWSYGKRTICFATDVETSNDIARRFNEVGIPAISVSAKTPTDVREDAIRRFKDGRIWVLINVDLFDEGFDVPGVECVIMARPTASLTKYLQMFGRAMRTLAGKLFGLIIDLVSNWKRHGFPDKPHYWSLDRRDKRAKREPDPEEIQLTACRECSRPYERCLPACPYCGWVPPLPVGGARTLEQVDGDLMLLDRDTLQRLRDAAVLESPASMGQRVADAAGPLAGKGAVNRQIARHGAQERLSAAIAQWAGCQRHKGRSDAESYRRFYLTTGIDVISALALDRKDMDSLAERVEGWYAA